MSGQETALARARVMRSALLSAGVPEVSIELQAGRPASGDPWNACKPFGAISHHIASYPTPAKPTPGLALVKAGRPDLEGPLCNGTAGVDLVYRIICLGYANHPGVGGPLTLSGPLGSFTVPRDSGRGYLWGTEYEGGFDDATWDRTYTNKRTGKTMTFREFMGRANAGLVRGIWSINGLGRTPLVGHDLSGYHGEHSTWTSRKIDRRGYTTASGRAEIRQYNTTTATPTPEDDVTAQDVWDYKIKPMLKGAKPMTARAMLASAHFRAGAANSKAWAAEQNAAAALRVSQANSKAIAALAKSVDPIVRTAVEDALRESEQARVTDASEAPEDAPDDTPEA